MTSGRSLVLGHTFRGQHAASRLQAVKVQNCTVSCVVLDCCTLSVSRSDSGPPFQSAIWTS